LGFNKCIVQSNKTPNKGRSVNVFYVVPQGVQGLTSQELPSRVKEHKEKNEKIKKRIRKKYNKRKPFSQVEITFGLILA